MANLSSSPGINASIDREPRRYVTWLVVVALHLGLLALFVSATRTRQTAAVVSQPFELLTIPAVTLPTHKAAASNLPRLRGDIALDIKPPTIEFPTLPSPASASDGQSAATDGVGAGIDWAAEARRELQAHEIRQNAPPSENHMAVRPEGEAWWPRAAHQKGDQYKTDNGDWVVWINSNCYQVATAAPRGYGMGPPMPQTYCRADSSTPRGDLFKEVAAYNKLHPAEAPATSSDSAAH